jgi:hypothetical protein
MLPHLAVFSDSLDGVSRLTVDHLIAAGGRTPPDTKKHMSKKTKASAKKVVKKSAKKKGKK